MDMNTKNDGKSIKSLWLNKGSKIKKGQYSGRSCSTGNNRWSKTIITAEDRLMARRFASCNIIEK